MMHAIELKFTDHGQRLEMTWQGSKLNIRCRIPIPENDPKLYIAFDWLDRESFFYGSIRLQTLNHKYSWQDVAIMESKIDKYALNTSMLYLPEGAWWQWSKLIYALPENIWKTSFAIISMPYAHGSDIYTLPLLD